MELAVLMATSGESGHPFERCPTCDVVIDGLSGSDFQSHVVISPCGHWGYPFGGKLQAPPGRSEQASESGRYGAEPTEVEKALAWLIDHSEGVVGLRADGALMPWEKVLACYLPWLSADFADNATFRRSSLGEMHGVNIYDVEDCDRCLRLDQECGYHQGEAAGGARMLDLIRRGIEDTEWLYHALTERDRTRSAHAVEQKLRTTGGPRRAEHECVAGPDAIVGGNPWIRYFCSTCGREMTNDPESNENVPAWYCGKVGCSQIGPHEHQGGIAPGQTSGGSDA